jgi:hypothetical protein
MLLKKLIGAFYELPLPIDMIFLKMMEEEKQHERAL